MANAPWKNAGGTTVYTKTDGAGDVTDPFRPRHVIEEDVDLDGATTLMAAVTAIANGTAMSVVGWRNVILVVSGTFTTVASITTTVLVDVSFDGGSTYVPIPVGPLHGPRASQISIQTIGYYGVDLPVGATHIRPRTTTNPAGTSVTFTAQGLVRLPGDGMRVDGSITQNDGPQVYGIDPDDHYLFVGGGATLYTVGDVIGEGTGGASIILPGMARVLGGGGRLRRITMKFRSALTSATTDPITYLVYLFRNAAAFSTLSDNGVFGLSADSDARRLVPGFPVRLTKKAEGGTFTGAALHHQFDSGPIDMGYQCPAGSTSMLMIVQTETAYTPGATDYYSFDLDRILD